MLRQLQEQEQRAKVTRTDPAKKRQLETTLNSKRIAFNEASSAASEIQKQVDVIVKKIEEKTTGKIKAINSKIKEVTNILKECKSEIAKLNVGITTSQR